MGARLRIAGATLRIAGAIKMVATTFEFCNAFLNSVIVPPAYLCLGLLGGVPRETGGVGVSPGSQKTKGVGYVLKN